MLRRFIDINRRASRALNRLLPERVTRDGNGCFLRETLPSAFAPGQVVLDIGGGSQPAVTVEQKRRLGLICIGFDISADELADAPPGIYDRTVVADLCTHRGDAAIADVAICQATLEHVPDTRAALLNIARMLRPGGRLYVFAPSRNACFARLNLILPQRLKERILYTVSPEVEQHQGFPAHYDRCTPRQIERIFAEAGLEVIERRLFWMSDYFMLFVPLFVLWRLWQGLFYLAVRDNAAETFIYVARKAG